MQLQYKAPELFQSKGDKLPNKIIHSGRGYILLCRILLSLIGIFCAAQAEAGPLEDLGCPVHVYISMPESISADPTLPIGSVISTVNAPAANTRNCVYGVVQVSSITITGVGTPNGNLYPTGVTGVSYRAHLEGGNYQASRYWPIPTTLFLFPNSPTIDRLFTSVVIELVKTGPIQPGIFQAMKLGVITFVEANNILPFPGVTFTTSNSVIIKNPSCTTSTPVIPVDLVPVVAGASLKNAGDTAGDKSFSIRLSCQSATNLSLRFSGDFTNASQAIYKNSDSQTGSSVGVQILKDNNPVPNGSAKLDLGVVSGDISPTFTARYYALTNKIAAGNVASVAFAEIIYN